MSSDTVAPIAAYRIAALRIDCPRDDCDGGLLGANGTTLIVRADGHHGGKVVACDECARQFVLPAV
ncbi:MAG: hypothetical protein AB7P40_27330, partial [Chloroflexota bacterium]